MKKRLIVIFIMAIAMALSVFALTACDNDCPDPVGPTVVHTVTFRMSDATNAASFSVAVVDGQRINEPFAPIGASGYTFTNWYLGNSPFAFTTPITQDITLVANWQAVSSGGGYPSTIVWHAVTFRILPTGGDTFVAFVRDGYAVNEPLAPARAGFYFDGWTYDGDDFDFATTINANKTLVASWTASTTAPAPQSFDVTFVLNNGDANIVSEVTSGSTVTLPANIENTGHSLVGWFLDQNGTVAFNANTLIGIDTTVYAIWSADSFELTYNSNTLEVVFGQYFALTTPTRPAAPHWDDFASMEDWQVAYDAWFSNYGYGMEFYGWFYNGTQLTDQYGASLAAWNIDSDATLTAVWQEDYHTALLLFTRVGAYYEVSRGTIANTVSSIIIPRTFNNIRVTAIANNAFSGLENITSVMLPSTITTIGNSAFYGTSLTQVRLGANVETVGALAFANISTLEAVFVDRAIRIPDANPAQSSRSATTEIQANTFDDSNPYVIMFKTFPVVNEARQTANNWSQFASIMHFSHFTNFDNNNANLATNLVRISPTYHALNFTPICEGRIVDNDEVIQAGRIIAYSVALRPEYRHLTNIIVPRIYNLRPVTHIDNDGFRHGMFREVRRNIGRSLVVTDLVLFDTITHIGNHAFANNFNLNIAHLHGNVESLGTHVFLENRNLQTFSFSGGDAPVVAPRLTEIPLRTFWDNRNLRTLTIPASVTTIGNEAFGLNLSLENVTFNSGLLHIGNDAFDGARRLDISGALPATLLTIGNNAFRNTTSWGAGGNARTVNLPNITSIGNNAFENSLIQTINITSTYANLTIGNNAFAGNIRLNSVTLPNHLTTLGNGLFVDTVSLDSITLPASLTAISNNLFQRSSLRAVTIPANVTTIGAFAFAAMPNFTEVVIPNSVTAIGASAFANSRLLASITLPTSLVTIGANAFGDTVAWRANVVLPSGVTTIGANAFQRSAIFSIVIPSGVLRIEANTFNATPNLVWAQLLRYEPGETAPNARITTIANANAFGPNTGTPAHVPARIYIPADSYDAYRVDAVATGAGNSVWNNAAFNNRMFATATAPVAPTIPPLP